MLRDGEQPIELLKPIEDMLVEEYETNVIRLSDYVSGSLVNYQLDIDYNNETESEGIKQDVLDLAR